MRYLAQSGNNMKNYPFFVDFITISCIFVSPTSQIAKLNPRQKSFWSFAKLVCGHFPEGQFPDGHFPEGQFPEGHFPDGQFPTRTFPRTDSSPTTPANHKCETKEIDETR